MATTNTNNTNTGTLPSSPPRSCSPSAPSPLQVVSSPLVLPLPSMKLTEKNYLVWRHFMIATLTSNRANRFVLGTEIPHRFLNDDDCLNKSQSSLSSLGGTRPIKSLQPRVVCCVHSWQLWEELDSFCNSQTKARSRKLRSQLRSISQGSNSISEYFTKIKGLVDALIFIGTPISVSEHIDYILDGLNEEYQSVITSVESQMDLHTVHNLESFLLTFEARLEKGKQKALSDALSVNVASNSSPSSNPVNSAIRSPSSQYAPRFDSFPNSSHYNGIGGGSGHFRGSYNASRSRRNGFGGRFCGGRSSNRYSLFCSFCNRHGHDIMTCYHAPLSLGNQLSYACPPGNYPPGSHMQHYSNYMPHHPIPHHSFMAGYGSTKYPAHFYPKYPHDFYPTSQAPYSSNFGADSLLGPSPRSNSRVPHPSYVMNAQVQHQDSLSPKDAKNVTWYPDSGATHHLTADPSLVHEPVEKFGHDQIFMGNGIGIPIKSVGNSKFSFTYNSEISLKLNNLLHVLYITKNLLSLSQFARDNMCYFEFHSHDYFVKSQATNEILLHGSLTKEGLYAFRGLFPHSKSCHVSSVFNHNLGSSVYVDLWGPVPIHSIGAFRYYFSIVDAYTKHTWIFLLKQKFETLSIFQYFLKYVHTQFNHFVKAVQIREDYALSKVEPDIR
ncbi:hypothetical protein Lal_00002779 [Lupinus albus]|nr:hypothetical protein Lal_00002779 [Lupinus albus]